MMVMYCGAKLRRLLFWCSDVWRSNGVVPHGKVLAKRRVFV